MSDMTKLPASGQKGRPKTALRFPVALFAILMLLDVGAAVCEKLAAVHADGTGLALLGELLTQPWVYVVLAIKLGQLFLWTAILARVDISLAFPITAIHIPLVMVTAAGMFGERMTPSTWAGALLITVGVFIIGPSHESRVTET